MMEAAHKTRNHILKRYRALAERYWRKAGAAKNALAKTQWTKLAAHFQEMASRREHLLAAVRRQPARKSGSGDDPVSRARRRLMH